MIRETSFKELIEDVQGIHIVTVTEPIIKAKGKFL